MGLSIDFGKTIMKIFFFFYYNEHYFPLWTLSAAINMFAKAFILDQEKNEIKTLLTL